MAVSRPRVLIADDHTLIAELFQKLLQSQFDVVSIVKDGRSLVRIAEEVKPDVILVGGTSLSSPALADIVNASNQRLGQAPPGGGFYHTGENNLLYSQLNAKTAYAKNFYDVTTGSNGVAAGPGYDNCTGIGSPRGKLGK